nr:MAG TPA: hypothetical protein [Caudoviricetes sp.]
MVALLRVGRVLSANALQQVVRLMAPVPAQVTAYLLCSQMASTCLTLRL